MKPNLYESEYEAEARARRQWDRPVIETGTGVSRDPAARIGLSCGSGMGGGFITRRTDTDRRPARPVLMPNERPDPNRHERSAQLIAALTRPQRVMPEANERMALVLRALTDGPLNNKQIATACGLRPGNTADLMTSAVAHGWVTKERVQGPKYSEVLIRLTPEGEAMVEARAA